MRNGPLDDSHDGDESTTTASTPPPKRLHAQIGRYRVDGVLGRSSGVVYRATQQNPHRPVALKVLRPDSRSPEALARLMQEAEILARLSHPHIAQVYESGTHDDGHGEAPYVAMEYVPNAKSLTKYANERSLNTAARLKLFQQVCEAVSHGHFKGVLHCDLKPSNILVNADGQVKVIDFGISQWMGASPGDPGGGSDYGQMLGTIPYMSPEQTEPDRSELDLRTDVYSLGVVLFELISGGLPFDTADKPRSEILRMIREDAPARLRDEKPDEPRDLEAIVERAMRKDRGERYQSVSELGQQIAEHLANRTGAIRVDSSLSASLRSTLFNFINSQPALVMLLAGVAVIAGALLIGEPITYDRLRLHQPYASALLSLTPAPEAAAPLNHVRILRIDDQTLRWAKEYAAAQGVQINPEQDRTGLRFVHGDLLEKLVDARPSVVVFDLYFVTNTPLDEHFVAGAEAMAGHGIDVVIATPLWNLRDTGTPLVAPNLIPHTRWGAACAGFTPDAEWYVDVLAYRNRNLPQYALSVVAAAAHRNPGLELNPSFEQEEGTSYLQIQFIKPAQDVRLREVDEHSPLRIAILGESTYESQGEGKDCGLVTGDKVTQFSFEVPPDSVLEPSTLSYEWVWSATPHELRTQLEGRVLIIADHTQGDWNEHPDGRRLHLSVGHASAVEAILDDNVVRYEARRTLMLIATAAGLLIGAIFASRWCRRLAVSLLVILALVGFSYLLFAQTRIVYLPVIAASSFIAASEFAAAIIRLNRGHFRRAYT